MVKAHIIVLNNLGMVYLKKSINFHNSIKHRMFKNNVTHGFFNFLITIL